MDSLGERLTGIWHKAEIHVTVALVDCKLGDVESLEAGRSSSHGSGIVIEYLVVVGGIKAKFECGDRILGESCAGSARGEPAVEHASLLVERHGLHRRAVEQPLSGGFVGHADVGVAEAENARAVVVLGPPPSSVGLQGESRVHGTVGNATSVVSERVVGAEVFLGLGVDAGFLLSALGERNHAEAGVAVVVVEVVINHAAVERVAECVSAHVANHDVGVAAIGAHHCDFTVAEDSVGIHLVAEVLAAVEDVDEILIIDARIEYVLRCHAAAHAHIEGEVLRALGELRLIDELVGLDVATVAGVVEGGSFHVGSNLHVHVVVGKAAVLAVDVEVGLHLNLLRTDVLELELAGIVDGSVLVRVSLKSGDWSAVGEHSALGHLPDVFANQVVGVRKCEVDGDIHIVDNHSLSALVGHLHRGHNVHDEDGVGARAHAVEGEGNFIFARLSIFVSRIRLGRGKTVAEVPLHGTAFR